MVLGSIETYSQPDTEAKVPSVEVVWTSTPARARPS
jgi:hypothetical protein